MHRFCAVGALFFALTVFAGCGTLNTSQFDAPQRQTAIAGSVSLSSVSAPVVGATGAAPYLAGSWIFDASKWYCDQD